MPLCDNLETAPRMGKLYLQDLVSFNNGLKAQSNDVPKRKTKKYFLQISPNTITGAEHSTRSLERGHIHITLVIISCYNFYISLLI